MSAKFELVMRATSAAVIVMDSRGEYVFANRAAFELQALEEQVPGAVAVRPRVDWLWDSLHAVADGLCWSGSLLCPTVFGQPLPVAINAFVLKGPLGQPLRVALVHKLRDAGLPPGRGATGLSPWDLTSTEIRLLQLMSEGFADKQIADVLSLSVWTVNKEVAAVLRKMDASSRTGACVMAIRAGVIV